MEEKIIQKYVNHGVIQFFFLISDFHIELELFWALSFMLHRQRWRKGNKKEKDKNILLPLI